MKKIIEDFFEIFYPGGEESFGTKVGFLFFVIITLIILSIVL